VNVSGGGAIGHVTLIFRHTQPVAFTISGQGSHLSGGGILSALGATKKPQPDGSNSMNGQPS
jgi:hypothetical protein